MDRTNEMPAVRPAQGERADNGTEIDLVELFFRLLASWKLIAALCLAGAILAFAYTAFLVTPMYRATATIYVLSRRDSAINMSDLQIGSALTQDYIKVFDMWEVHEQVLTDQVLPYDYAYMRRHLSVTNTANTRMLDISFTSPDPLEAAGVANAYAAIGSDYIAETMSTDRPNIMSVALAPANPYSPSMTKNVAIGFLLGGIVAAGIVFARMMLDDKIRTAEDIRRYTGLANLAIVPREDTVEEPEGEKKSKGGKRA